MESRDGRRGGRGGVTWHAMFLWVPLRRVFGMVAAFTLMMQFHQSQDSACSSATATTKPVSIIVRLRLALVPPGLAKGNRVPQSLLHKQLAATLSR